MSASLTLIWLAILYLLYELYGNRRNPRFVWSVWRRFNLLMLLEVVCLILVVAAAFIAIIELFPITSYGWTSLMVKNSTNILVAPATLIPKNGQLGTKVFGVFFLLLFLLAVPFMAKAEEDLFRRGKSGPKSIVINSIYFGLAHLIVGVPLGVALALIITGFFYANKYIHKYQAVSQLAIKKLVESSNLIDINEGVYQAIERNSREEAVMESTAYHALYNSVLVIIFLITTFVG